MSSVPESVQATPLVLCYSQVVNTEPNPYVLIEEDWEGFFINTLADSENSQIEQSFQSLSCVACSINASIHEKYMGVNGAANFIWKTEKSRGRRSQSFLRFGI